MSWCGGVWTRRSRGGRAIVCTRVVRWHGTRVARWSGGRPCDHRPTTWYGATVARWSPSENPDLAKCPNCGRAIIARLRRGCRCDCFPFFARGIPGGRCEGRGTPPPMVVQTPPRHPPRGRSRRTRVAGILHRYTLANRPTVAVVCDGRGVLRTRVAGIPPGGRESSYEGRGDTVPIHPRESPGGRSRMRGSRGSPYEGRGDTLATTPRWSHPVSRVAANPCDYRAMVAASCDGRGDSVRLSGDVRTPATIARPQLGHLANSGFRTGGGRGEERAMVVLGPMVEGRSRDGRTRRRSGDHAVARIVRWSHDPRPEIGLHGTTIGRWSYDDRPIVVHDHRPIIARPATQQR